MNEELPGRDALGAGLDDVPGMAERLMELLQAGGPVVMILLGMSVFAATIVVVKVLSFRAMRIADRQVSLQVLERWWAGDAREALALADASPNPVAQSLARAIRGRRRKLPEAMVREEVLRYGGDALESLRSWFRPLEVIATLAPLLGLFGTVLGMIEAFRELERAGSQVNPAILSGGIWEALLTTAVGLAVAIPVVAMLNWLERRVDRVAHDMDSIVTRIFTQDLSSDSVTESSENSHAPARIRSASVGE